MKTQHYNDLVTDELLIGTLDHDVYPGFLEDYRVLSCLLRIHKPKSIFEVGSNIGVGICVMRAALPKAKIFSLDLDYETMKQNSKQYPIGADGEDRVGSAAREIEYTQLRGDSLIFDYKKYPCEAYFCDGEHSYKYVYQETCGMLDQNPILIIYHDTDVKEVLDAIKDALSSHDKGNKYYLYRVTDTRISYLLRNDYARMETNKGL